ncbi:MAG: metalloregulator ArsR/SmtB family transcription factor [Candidatus Portnoybacteria bacterium]|nr:metalloregulator ArsR/SmtB family transcription factor [Candidatus Portnoybacteria bacterium]MDD4983135.1 metalloregulator ArsR/SmtB family transcription factor [Candidatus Portnoybacteria bacterium]
MSGKMKAKKEFVRFADFLKTIGHPNRLKIICLLLGHKKICVSEVALRSGLSVADASHHLRVMARRGILRPQRRGKEICYAIGSGEFVSDIKRLICKYK